MVAVARKALHARSGTYTRAGHQVSSVHIRKIENDLESGATLFPQQKVPLNSPAVVIETRPRKDDRGNRLVG